LDFDNYLIVGALAVFTLTLNMPFGILRARSRQYSLRWFLCIHLPIPVVYLLRKLLDFEWSIGPLLLVLAAAVAGQIWGGKIRAPKTD
jgi:hypothetical protein